MNYNIKSATQLRQPFDELNLNVAMNTGTMPHAMLMSKFEETDIDLNEGIYDNFARNTLMDRRPDKATFEHEGARGSIGNAGRLQLQYYGHRGDSNDPAHPEMFLGFAGPENRDPRGTAIDPDMKKLVEQENARMRFIRFTSDANNSITGGGRSESQVMRDQQKLFKISKDRLKIFDRQIDGRINGHHLPTYLHKSCVEKQQNTKCYGDVVPDDIRNPQRRVNIISDHIIRDTRQFRSETNDQTFNIASYTQNRKNGKLSGNESLRNMYTTDSDWSTSKNTKCYKAAAILMSELIKRKSLQTHTGDMDYSETMNTSARKNTPIARDLSLILRSLVHDNEFKNSTESLSIKTKNVERLKHLTQLSTESHITPAHHYLNADVIYKGLREGKNMRKIKDKIITDANAPDIQDQYTKFGKSLKGKKSASVAELFGKSTIDIEGESTITHNYKTAKLLNGDKRIRHTSGEDFKKESTNTQVRKQLDKTYRNANINDTEEDMRFNDNSLKERLGGKLGSKYMMKHIDREISTKTIAGMA